MHFINGFYICIYKTASSLCLNLLLVFLCLSWVLKLWKGLMGLLPPLWGAVNVCSLALPRRNSISTPAGLHCSCWKPRQSFLLPDLAGSICSSLHGQPGGLSNPSPGPKVTQSSDAAWRACFHLGFSLQLWGPRTQKVLERSQGWNLSALETDWERGGWSAWGRESSGDTSGAFLGSKGACKKKEIVEGLWAKDWSARTRRMASHWERAGLDQLLGRHSSPCDIC